MQHKRAMEKWWFGNSETNTSGRNEKAKTTVKRNAYMKTTEVLSNTVCTAPWTEVNVGFKAGIP